MTTMEIEGTGFLAIPKPTAAVQRLYDSDIEQLGFVMNLSGLWAHQPGLHGALFDMIDRAARAAGLTFRQRGVLVAAAAATLGDSYCSIAWGKKLAGVAGADLAGDVLRGDDARLDPDERALAGWARKVCRHPSSTKAEDVQPLRDAGYDDGQIFAITTFIALRVAFAVVNDSLGARPDHELIEAAPAPVRDAVTYGRPAARKASVIAGAARPR
jgi:alkylhydroperoxidase family enzyme